MKELTKTESVNNGGENCKDETRRSRLVARRNRSLIARFYYWTEIKRLRFDDVLEVLQEKE